MSAPLPDAALDQIFRTARTYNGYVDKPVSTDQLRAIWDLMKMGPTSANMLPARLVWCVSDDAKAKLAACAMPKNGEKIVAAPVAVVIGYDIDFHENLPWLFPHDQTAQHWWPDQAAREPHAFRNASLQGAYFMIAARALGLDTGPMSGFSNEAVDKAFFADRPNVRSNFISTLGYGDPATIFERSPRPEFEKFNRIV
jgi:3-hydroxypropanoate dehydrogenase